MSGAARPSDAADAADAADHDALYPPAFRRRAVLLLLAVYTFNFLDRQILNIVAEAIKTDLHLADWQIGVMSGLSFALLYSLLSIPVARYAERGDRPRIVATAVAVWSAATAMCGFAGNFVQLVLARVVVGVGEAGGTPPSHSLIAEYYPRRERASALALYSLGIPLGILLGLALGGLIAGWAGWRAAFLLASLPGFVLAVLSLVILREPRRRRNLGTSPVAPPLNFVAAMRALAKIRTFWFVMLGGVAVSISSNGVGAFLVPFFLRTHDAELAALAATFGLKTIGFLGLVLGLTAGIAGCLGTWGSGWIADRLARRDRRAYVLLPAITTLLVAPCYFMMLGSRSVVAALVWHAFAGMFVSAWYGPVHATAQSIVPPYLRATISAVILSAVNLIALGCGPLLVGVLSDIFNVRLGLGGADGLRLAMECGLVFAILGSVAFACAARTIDTEIVS